MAKDLDRSLATTEQLIVAGAEFVDWHLAVTLILGDDKSHFGSYLKISKTN